MYRAKKPPYTTISFYQTLPLRNSLLEKKQNPSRVQSTYHNRRTLPAKKCFPQPAINSRSANTRRLTAMSRRDWRRRRVSP